MKKKLIIILAILYCSFSYGQIVNIPDSIFKEALVNNESYGGFVIDTNNDGEIQITEAEAIVDTLKVIGIYFEEKITNMTGIEAFVNITGLNCGANEISDLNLSNNQFLLYLGCGGNQLSILNISNCFELKSLYCQGNQLNELDITNNPNLQNLMCGENQLINLDVSNNPNLEILHCSENQLFDINLDNNANIGSFACGNNQLSSLNVSNLPLLWGLYCNDNYLDSLDINNNPLIKNLYCWENEIVFLDLSNNQNLENLSCSNNQLETLDLSNNMALDWFICQNNQLIDLDLRNGFSTNLSNFNAKNNPYLTCIFVEDANYFNENWLEKKDKTAHFVETDEECEIISTTFTFIPDDNFEQRLIDIGLDVDLDDTVLTYNINYLTYLDISSLELTELTGIEDFVMLKTFFCHDNLLTSVDVTNSPFLEILNCGNNQLNNLDVTNNFELQELICNHNQLTNIDLSNNINLIKLGCYNNLLISLDVSNNTLLDFFTTYDNQLTSLDLSNNTVLRSLYCGENQITNLDLSSNSNLQDVYCKDNLLTQLNTDNNPELDRLSCYDNQLINLDLSNNYNLTELHCYSNQLNEIDVRNGNNTNFFNFNATNNLDLTCIFVDNAAWSYANWTFIDPNSHFVETQEECDDLTIIRNEFANYPMIMIQPNPVENSFIISPILDIVEIKIYDLFGQLIDTYKPKHQYSVSHLKAGIYFVLIGTETGNVICRKIIKQKI